MNPTAYPAGLTTPTTPASCPTDRYLLRARRLGVVVMAVVFALLTADHALVSLPPAVVGAANSLFAVGTTLVMVATNRPRHQGHAAVTAVSNGRHG